VSPFALPLSDPLPIVASNPLLLTGETVDSSLTDLSADQLLARWQQGDEAAATEMFRRYAQRLVALARSRLSDRLAHRVDPEDVVQSAYRSFFVAAREGRFELEHGGDLWQLLVTIMLHKLHRQVRRNTADKRSVEREQSLDDRPILLRVQPQLLAQEPTPIEAVALVDELEQLMKSLNSVEQRMVELRLQGYNLDEIADKTERSERTVRRLLERIKEQLEADQLANHQS
jgi:RNA polymerase sigma factor (sigma-70 family)